MPNWKWELWWNDLKKDGMNQICYRIIWSKKIILKFFCLLIFKYEKNSFYFLERKMALWNILDIRRWIDSQILFKFSCSLKHYDIPIWNMKIQMLKKNSKMCVNFRLLYVSFYSRAMLQISMNRVPSFVIPTVTVMKFSCVLFYCRQPLIHSSIHSTISRLISTNSIQKKEQRQIVLN